MKKLVRDILEPYRISVVSKLGLKEDQRMIALFDCWSVQRSKVFLQWLKDNFPYILPLFVPGRCTSKYQPADVGLQRPIKHSIKSRFQAYAAKEVMRQIKSGKKAEDVRLEFNTMTLRRKVVAWTQLTFQQVQEQKQLIVKTWSKCGLLRAFDADFQKNAQAEAAIGTLAPDDEQLQEEEHIESFSDLREEDGSEVSWLEVFTASASGKTQPLMHHQGQVSASQASVSIDNALQEFHEFLASRKVADSV
jgi:hypothetical protein